ncbi:MAG: EamA family transporter [Candidatus Omnitrophica bacterium]|nr:EamA family transporter [Candidatus Omnitrophota bacterium]
MIKKRLTLKIILFLIISDIFETLVHLCFKKGAQAQDYLDIHTIRDGLTFLVGVSSSPYLWLGLFFALVTFITWSTILSKIDLSVAVPIASLSYILVPLTSSIFLKENISLLRWGGVIFILIGVVFVSLSSQEKEVVLK